MTIGKEIRQTIENRFNSGNSVHVDSVRLTHDEWEALKRLQKYSEFRAKAQLFEQVAGWVRNDIADLSEKNLLASAAMYRAAAEDSV